jgi:hypothetical protein
MNASILCPAALVTAFTVLGCGSGSGNGGGPHAGGASSSAATSTSQNGVAAASSSSTSASGAGGAIGGGGAAQTVGVGGTTASSSGAGSGGAGGFVHPGILVNAAQLDFVKAKIGANAAPWMAAFDQAKNSDSGSLSYKPKPIAVVECGPYSNPDIGCTEEKNDVKAAYTQALLWYLTGDEAYAKKAIEIMNAWSSTLMDHTNSNAPLQSAWCASVFPRAAEIIRYTYDGWAKADEAAFEAMLKNVYLPQVVGGSSSNGNWELSMAEATIAIGVFLDDAATFDTAVTMWKKRVPAYVYLQSDGALPVPPPSGNKNDKNALIGYWYNQSTFVDGLSQETCRDLGHVQYGFAAMTNAAETARIQGTDLYAAEQKRITAAYEFHAKYLNGAAVPGWLCNGSLNAVSPDPMWEIGYNEYANRLGLTLPETKKLVDAIRPTGADHHMVWETLTHAEVGAVGLAP